MRESPPVILVIFKDHVLGSNDTFTSFFITNKDYLPPQLRPFSYSSLPDHVHTNFLESLCVKPLTIGIFFGVSKLLISATDRQPELTLVQVLLSGTRQSL